MNVSILNIGDELLIGQVVNTNASRMAQMLTAAGMEVRNTYVIGDNGEEIERYLRLCLDRSDAVLMTGGLGPTKDDITKKVLCDFFDSELYENEEALANVKRIFDARGYELTPINRQQAWVPRCCTMINNSVGTAPCMWFDLPEDDEDEWGGKVVVSMPGVPFEMEHLMETEIVSRLRDHFHCDYILNKNILVQGIGESFLSDLIEPWELALPKTLRLAYLPQAGMVKLRLTARGNDKSLLEQQISKALDGLYPIAGQYIVGEDLETLPELVAQTFCNKRKTLASAESCTGGTIASKLTALPGASNYFLGSVVAYSNDVKNKVLGVSQTILDTQGAVSEECVRAMAEGVREKLGSDYGVATSGIAGPTGGTPEKPVGMVWIALAGPNGTIAKKMKYGDRRAQTIERTCNEVFSQLVKIAKEDS